MLVEEIEGGAYVLRVQPPLGAAADYNVEIATSPLLAFPVAGVDGRAAERGPTPLVGMGKIGLEHGPASVVGVHARPLPQGVLEVFDQGAHRVRGADRPPGDLPAHEHDPCSAHLGDLGAHLAQLLGAQPCLARRQLGQDPHAPLTGHDDAPHGRSRSGQKLGNEPLHPSWRQAIRRSKAAPGSGATLPSQPGAGPTRSGLFRVTLTVHPRPSPS